ncbi:DUF484 family protein [Algicella marina]|uniref:DUF484 family protein n=2 Tax=Algicella marina TaxID=2683284 RepID=A0A6P1T6W6_9RHOB|nr:DUF484 family protein [Algicella marina]
MAALLEAGGTSSAGRNVVDLRGKLVDRLEDRLDRLEETHRHVIAAAYENLAGTQQVHRAVLALLEAASFKEFLASLGQDVANILSLDVIRLGLETASAAPGQALGPAGPLATTVIALPKGSIDSYLTGNPEVAPRRVTLRPTRAELDGLYADQPKWVQSEALIKLDLGPGTLPGLLALGAEDAQRFHPEQGTDLLNFFGLSFEKMLRRWLA